MTKELVISTTSHETRVALLEGGHIAELYIERERERGDCRKYLQGAGYPRAAWDAGGVRRYRPGEGGVSLCR